MSKIEQNIIFKAKLEKLLKKLDQVPEEFWPRTTRGTHRAIWFLDRQKPSVQASYDFDVERFGVTKDGKIIWGFDSGCSCPSPWENDNYETKEWKEFILAALPEFDTDWQEEIARTIDDFLLLIDKKAKAADIIKCKNAEVRRYLIKRIGFDTLKKHLKAEVVHEDGSSQLLKMENGEQYVKVKDSSTEREYLLYVPDHIKRCKEGIAWTFGLRENEYEPIIET